MERLLPCSVIGYRGKAAEQTKREMYSWDNRRKEETADGGY